MNFLLIIIGKFTSFVSRISGRGHGSTWPGHIALSVNKNFIKDTLKNSKIKIILIAGTNGKTTTTSLVQTILEKDGKEVIHNVSGANLLNGIASTLLLHSNIFGQISADFAIFEIDENTLPLVLGQTSPEYILLLNLFRDQLDRYGEVNSIVLKWKDALSKLDDKTTLILNADDPQIAYLGKDLPAKPLYFGINDKNLHQKQIQHASDSTHCPKCGTKLEYQYRYYSHLGVWTCKKCGLKRSDTAIQKVSHYPLPGIYNIYNTHAAVTLANALHISDQTTDSALHEFKPAFGRQEVFEEDGRKIQIFLSKNPTSFNVSLRTVKDLQGKHILLLLNDRIPDGRDISWIWDIDTEELVKDDIHVLISGDRAHDMGLRIKYSSSSEFSFFNLKFSMKNSNFKFQIEDNLKKAINLGLEQTPKSETLYILATYSAMLEVRKLITGKKIL